MKQQFLFLPMMGSGSESPHVQSLGGICYPGFSSLKNWEMWGKKENLRFFFSHQIKHNNKGERFFQLFVPSAPSLQLDMSIQIGLIRRKA